MPIVGTRVSTMEKLPFGSPPLLNLQRGCAPQTPAGALDIWPALPLVVQGHISPTSVDNTVVALRCSSHICKIDPWGSSGPELENVLAAMLQAYPEITHMQSGAYDAPIVPELFLGRSGSAPRVQYLQLERIPFLGLLPKLLLSTIYLVQLHLYSILNLGTFHPR